jgi:hypothetical protein
MLAGKTILNSMTCISDLKYTLSGQWIQQIATIGQIISVRNGACCLLAILYGLRRLEIASPLPVPFEALQQQARASNL